MQHMLQTHLIPISKTFWDLNCKQLRTKLRNLRQCFLHSSQTEFQKNTDTQLTWKVNEGGTESECVCRVKCHVCPHANGPAN